MQKKFIFLILVVLSLFMFSSCDKTVDGKDGKSAYEIAIDNGFVGTEEEWLESLKGIDGKDGSNGVNGTNGKSAYEIAVGNGFVGTENEWLESLKGKDGKDFLNDNNDLKLNFSFGDYVIVYDEVSCDLVSKFIVAIRLDCSRIDVIDDLVNYNNFEESDEYLISINDSMNYEFLGFFYKDELISKNKEMIFSKNVEIDARFRQINFNKLTVKSNDETLGTVEFQNDIFYSGKFVDARIFTGDLVTMIAKPKEHAKFLGWFDQEGQLVSRSLVYSMRMPDENYELIGEFASDSI